MSDLRIADMLQGQLTQTDPFQQARSQFDTQQSGMQAMELNTLMSGGPDTQSIGGQNQALQQQATTQPFSELLSRSPLDRTNFETSKLPKALQQAGVDDKMLALNDLGRVQLMGRLKNKFGPNFETNPQALELLSLFDSQMKAGGDKSTSSMKTAVATGERTLAALFGGK